VTIRARTGFPETGWTAGLWLNFAWFAAWSASASTTEERTGDAGTSGVMYIARSEKVAVCNADDATDSGERTIRLASALADARIEAADAIGVDGNV
jgi:hypothetical protein